MVKEKKDLCGPNCNQAKFYIVALVLVVGVVAIFSMYLGANLTGNALIDRNVESLRAPGDRCIKDTECESGSCINRYCTGLPIGGACSGNDDCEVSACSREEGVCGGKGARCYSDNACLNGCDKNQNVCKGTKQLNEACNDDVDCSGNFRCSSNANSVKVCTY